jgi:hypothetical protein
LPLLFLQPWKLSIRDAFQLVFFVFGVAYLMLFMAALTLAV